MPEDRFKQLEDIEKEFEATSSTLEEVRGGSEEDLDSQVRIELKDEGTKAYLYLTAPRLDGRLLELEEIVTQLKNTGIREFDEEALRQAIEKREFGRPILIASGRPPSKGGKARIIIKVADGESAKAGQLLAIKETAGQGEQGWDVYGNQIPGLSGDDVKLTVDAGVRLSEDGTRAYAEVDGLVYWAGNKVEIRSLKEPPTRLSQDEIEDFEETITEKHRIGQDGGAEVVIDTEGLEAYLVIIPPGPGGQPLDLKGAVDALTIEGVVNIDEERLREAIREEVFNKPILVASGIPPIKGEDAYLTNRVETGENVDPEQLLVVKVPATQGCAGRSVRGEIIPGLWGDDITLIAGENVRLSNDRLRVYATDYGEVRWEGEMVSVLVSGTLDDQMGLEDIERELTTIERSLRGMRPLVSNMDGQVDVTISEDKSEAYITIIPPRIGGEPIQMEAILSALREKGIQEVDREEIQKALMERRFNKKILVAKGLAPTKGDDAHFVYRFGVDEEGNLLRERAVPGQLLMVKSLPTRGSSGMAVTGETLPGQFGRQFETRPGKGVILSEDGTRAYATRPGRVVWREDLVSVEEVKEVEGDLNIGDGPIDFSGMVIINGFVGDKVMVKTQSDIIITGGVGDASIISGGEIKIQQAIFGKGEGRITAKGGLTALSIEGMTIEVEGNLIVDDFIQKSNIIAKRVICGGQIEGGKVFAGELIEAKILGSETKTRTVLKVDRGGRISGREAVHQGVELHIDTVSLIIKSPKQGMSFELEGSRIKEGPYLKTEVENLLLPKEKVSLKDLVPSVVIDSPTIDEGRAMGARLLGLTPTSVDVKVIRRDEERETVSIRVFPAGAAGPWDTKDEIDIELEGLCEKESDGYYQLANTVEGLHLTVFPPIGGGARVNIENLLKMIEANEFTGVDEVLLKKTVTDARGIPVKIAERQYRPELDGLAKVEISDDKKKAELTLVPPQSGGLPVSFEDVLISLEEKGVVAGIKRDIIHQMIKEEKFGIPVIVAEEIPPVSCKDTIKFHFDPLPTKARLIEDERGRVDFKELNIIQGVTAGQVLATQTVVTDVRPGQQITGEEIPPVIEDIRLLAGKNTEVSRDGSRLCSTMNGHIIFLEGRINVEPLYEIKGDVDISTGNIDFLGTVDIAGSVEDGFKVRADGDIQVRGGVGKATLSARGSINIGQGIQANHKGKIWAGKEIICKFVQMGNLFARGDIIVHEVALHSELNAGGSISVTGKRGSIIGGKTRARNEVTAKIIGCEMSTRTIIEVGAPPGIIEQISTLYRLMNEDLKEFKQHKINILNLKHAKETTGLSPEREELLSQLVNTQSVLAARLHTLAKRKEALEKDLLGSTGGLVNVLEAVYPGTVIVIRNSAFEVMERLGPTTFYLEGDQVKQRPLGRIEKGAA